MCAFDIGLFDKRDVLTVNDPLGQESADAVIDHVPLTAAADNTRISSLKCRFRRQLTRLKQKARNLPAKKG